MSSGKVRRRLNGANLPHTIVSACTISVGRFCLKTGGPLKLDGLGATIGLYHLPSFNISAPAQQLCVSLKVL